MGAEKGNYTVSDLCMTVGFGLGLKVWSQDDRNQSETGDSALVREHISGRPPNGDPAVSEVRPGALCTCPATKLPRRWQTPEKLPHR